MRLSRETNNLLAAQVVLQQSAARNIGGILSKDLYSKTNTGEPNDVVLEFASEIERTVDFLLRKNVESSSTSKVSISRRSTRLIKAYDAFYGHKATILAKRMRRLLVNAITADETGSFDGNSADGHSSDGEADTDPLTDSENGSKEGKNLNVSTAEMVAVLRKESQAVLQRARAAYGKTALCLSGGGKNAGSHFGVIQALLEEDLLPDIVAGTSAGSLTAAFIGTHTDEELKRDLTVKNILEHARFGDFASGVSTFRCIYDYFTKGHVFTANNIVDHVKWFCLGTTTFEEAHKRTGKILNISVSPTKKNASPVLLNYISAPNVVIYSAVLASAAIPGVFAPARLYVKTKDGKVIPQGSGHQLYWDGTVAMDIPTTFLREMFNCTYFITAQANPHVAPLVFSNRGDVAQPSPWQLHEDDACCYRGGILLGLLESLLKQLIVAKTNFLAGTDREVPATDIVRHTEECPVVIVARQRIRTYLTLIQTPSDSEWPRLLHDGRIAAYRNMAMIRVNERISQALTVGVRGLRNNSYWKVTNTWRLADFRSSPSKKF